MWRENELTCYRQACNINLFMFHVQAIRGKNATNVKLHKYLIKRTSLLPGLPCLVDLTQRLQLTGAVGPIRDILSSLWVDLPGMYNTTQIQCRADTTNRAFGKSNFRWRGLTSKGSFYRFFALFPIRTIPKQKTCFKPKKFMISFFFELALRFSTKIHKIYF